MISDTQKFISHFCQYRIREVKSMISFLCKIFGCDVVREIINKHIDKIHNSTDYGI